MKLLQSESIRKSIHLSSLVIPFAYKYIFHFNRKLMFTMMLTALIIALIIELYRFEQATFRKLFFKLFRLILRRHEFRDFTGATYLLFSGMLSVAFFEPIIAFCAMAFLSIGDTFAAIIGIRFGRRKFLGMNKSVEGSLACFITTFCFGLVFLGRPLVALTGALAATTAELWKIPVDDNVKIPLLSGLVMMLITIIPV